MIGTQIGPYVLLRLLGAGAMGTVYLAEHSLMKDLHAIKILNPQWTQNAQLVTRFVNEARAAAKVRHRNLVRVYNIDRMPDDGPWFMVLDYLEGSTLARVMKSHDGPMAPSLILHILAQVANCMQLVHDNKIVHRDLKPDNIFLIRSGDDPHVPIVLDLGVAQLSEDLTSGPITRSGTVVGTPLYMAPEQLRGQRVVPAADIFALGVIAYEMSTGGYFPYQYDEPRAVYLQLPPTEIYFRQRVGPPVDPRRRHAGITDAWVEVLRRALELDPAKRPGSARDLALLLADALPPDGRQPGGHAIVDQVARELVQTRGSANRLPMPRAPSQVPTKASEPIGTLAEVASESVRVPRPGRRWGVIAATASAAVVAGTITAIVTRPSAPADPAARDDRRAAAIDVDRAAAPRPDTGARAWPSKAPPEAAIAAAAVPADARVSLPVGTDRRAAITGQASDASVPADADRRAALASQASDASVPADADRRAAITGDASDASSGAAPDAPAPVIAAEDPVAGGAAAPGKTLPQAPAPRRTGELVIIVRPWALIWLNGKSVGQTPFRNRVAAGRYRVRIANDVARQDETVTITVEPDRSITVERKW